jgi:hypothetical protein
MNFDHSWVPLGSQRMTYSAPTIAMAKLLGFRLMVEQIISPSGLSNCWQAVR